tara:strand:- start:314 stop:565 length:252 start_codon:yes stop_codon:yes gene_type:complete
MAITRHQKGFMKLKDWIKKEGHSYTKTAKIFGIKNKNPATNIQRYSEGERIPHPVVMKKIKVATNNKVQPNDFYEDYWQQKKV